MLLDLPRLAWLERLGQGDLHPAASFGQAVEMAQRLQFTHLS